MANPEHLEMLQEGVDDWNQWRKEKPEMEPNFAGADLHELNLRAANLARANMYDVDLSGVYMPRVRLANADLTSADLSEATLCWGDLTGANLRWAMMASANLDDANLSNANLASSDMQDAKLRRANLLLSKLVRAQLSRTNLSAANLTGADLRSASMQESIFDGATLTDAKLWETQHAGWSIKGIICERAYWDENAEKPTEYSAGEFERLYSNQTCIELVYEGGLSTFELSTLPALLQHLASRHLGTNIRLKSIEETGGGAKVTISLGDADEQTKTKVEVDAMQVVRAQLALRDDEIRRLQLEQRYLENYVPKLMKEILSTTAPHITFNAPVHTATLPSGNAKVELHQTFNDNTELVQLIDKLLTRNTELTTGQYAEVEAAKAELQKPNPDKSLLTRTFDFFKTLPKEAVLKGAGKLGEKAAEADWSNLLHQLGELIHHLR